MDKFVNLHCHGHHSLLDGLGKPQGYAARAAELGQSALALTDHGSLSGAFAHFNACNAAGIKPIIGVEAYVAPGDRTDRTAVPGFSGSGKYGHITLLARGSGGLRNLYRLQHEGFDSGFYGKPRVDLEALAEFSDGVTCLTGCAAGHVATYLRQDRHDEAIRFASELKDIFGEYLYVELMNHGIERPGDLEESKLNAQLIELAGTLDLPLVATNDAHYCLPGDAEVHDGFVCIKGKSTIHDPRKGLREAFANGGFHLKSYDEMMQLGLPEEALLNTLAIAESVGAYDNFEHNLRMPTYSDDGGYYLAVNAQEGLQDRLGLGSGDMPEYYRKRLAFESDVINRMGYPGYFLVLADIIKEGRERGFRFGPGRGSAGGSLVAFALGITDLDPIVHNLIFERFLNPSRISLPDIDIDVAEHQRQPLIELIRQKYGDENVAVIGTFGTIAARAALKDATRVLGGSFSRGEELCSQLPPAKLGRSPGLDKFGGDKAAPEYRLALGFEGIIRSMGQHAAGVVISPVPLNSEIPLWRPADQDVFVTGYHNENKNPEIEKLGFTKYDFLGVRNLSVIDECLRMLELPVGHALPVHPDDCNDPRTYELLASGETLGVFQLDSPGMRGLLRLLQPTRFDDISAVLALYRPGPMGANAHVEFSHRKNDNGGRWRSSWAIHPELEDALRPVLADTFGLIVFQEQVLAALRAVCGWSYAEAGLLFDSMRKKLTEKMLATKPAYLAAGESQGFSAEALEALWETLVPFADYSFNRAHTAGYGLVSYWTAYLKANHPVEFMAALLSSVASDPDHLHEYLAECQRMGIELTTPDINISREGFTPDGGSIRYGLGAIKGVGENATESILSERPYGSLGDFLLRCPRNALNAGVFAALTKSGALQGLHRDRGELLADSVRLLDLATGDRKARDAGQLPLVPGNYAATVSVGAERQDDGALEREVLGVQLSHPEVRVRARRWLTETELEFLRRTVAASPGQRRAVLDLGGGVTYQLGNISATERTVQALMAIGGLELV